MEDLMRLPGQGNRVDLPLPFLSWNIWPCQILLLHLLTVLWYSVGLLCYGADCRPCMDRPPLVL